jgi:hypothetical protein
MEGGQKKGDAEGEDQPFLGVATAEGKIMNIVCK